MCKCKFVSISFKKQRKQNNLLNMLVGLYISEQLNNKHLVVYKNPMTNGVIWTENWII